MGNGRQIVAAIAKTPCLRRPSPAAGRGRASFAGAPRTDNQKQCARPYPPGAAPTQEQTMAKGQQNANKMVKKPKKDTSPPKPVSPDAVRPTVTTVVPVRGKLKNAPSR